LNGYSTPIFAFAFLINFPENKLKSDEIEKEITKPAN